MSVRKYVTSKYQPQHQWQFTSATRDNTSNGDMSRRRVPLFFKKKRKQYKHLHGEKKKKVSQMVWMRTVITYLVDGQSTIEQREGEKIGNEISKSRKREREKKNRTEAWGGKKRTKIKQIQREKTQVMRADRERDAQRDSLSCVRAAFQFSFKLLFFFFSLSFALDLSVSRRRVVPATLSRFPSLSSVSRVPAARIHRGTDEEEEQGTYKRGRKANEKWLFFFCFFFNSRPTSVFLRLAWQTEGFILLIYVPHSLIRSHSCLNMNNAERRRWEKAADDNLLLMSAGFYLHMSFTPRFSLGL